jgi:hypothetical protein
MKIMGDKESLTRFGQDFTICVIAGTGSGKGHDPEMGDDTFGGLVEKANVRGCDRIFPSLDTIPGFI